MASRSQKDLSQQTSCEADTGLITPTQLRKCSHHDQSLNDDKPVHTFISNNNYMNEINSGNSDEKANTTSSAVDHHHSAASSREDALLLIGIGSQFEKVTTQNVWEVALEENFTPVGPVHCPYTTSGGIQRRPMERYLSEAAEEGPWMGEDDFLGWRVSGCEREGSWEYERRFENSSACTTAKNLRTGGLGERRHNPVPQPALSPPLTDWLTDLEGLAWLAGYSGYFNTSVCR